MNVIFCCTPTLCFSCHCCAHSPHALTPEIAFCSLPPHRAFKDPRFSGRPRALQKVMSALFASSSSGGAGDEEKNGGIVFAHGQGGDSIDFLIPKFLPRVFPTQYYQKLAVNRDY